MRMILAFAAVCLTSTSAIADGDQVNIPCTEMQIIQEDGIKTLSSIPSVSFLEGNGEITVGRYRGTTMTFSLHGSGEIVCQLHEQNSNSE